MEHTARFDVVDQRFETIDQRFDRIENRLDKHDEQFDKVILELLSLRGEVDNIKEVMSTKSDISTLLEGQDHIMKILTKLDEERIMNIAAQRRIQDTVDVHEEKIAEHEVAIAGLQAQAMAA